MAFISGVAGIVTSAISAGASLAGTSISAMNANANNRNVVIEITNHLEVPLYGGNYFVEWGYNRIPPRSVVRAYTREAAQFDKVGDTATGTSGILAYSIGDKDDPARFAIIFSVPYNYIHSSNWYGLKIIGENDDIDKEMYDSMYGDSVWSNPRKYNGVMYGYASDGKPIGVFYKDYVISASMSDVGRSTISLEVSKIKKGYSIEELFR